MPGGGMRIKSHAEHPSMLKGDYNVKNMLIQYESVENEAPPDTSFAMNFKFEDGDLNGLELIGGGALVFHQNEMVRLEYNQKLARTFVPNTPLIRDNNLVDMTIRVKLFSKNNDWSVSGYNSETLTDSWMFHDGIGKLAWSQNGVLQRQSAVNTVSQVNEYVLVKTGTLIKWYVNGAYHNYTTVSSEAVAEWDTIEINKNAAVPSFGNPSIHYYDKNGM